MQRYRAEKSAALETNLSVVESFLARLAVLPCDLRAAQHTGELRVALQRLGRPIGPYDQMIAGIPGSGGCSLVALITAAVSRSASDVCRVHLDNIVI